MNLETFKKKCGTQERVFIVFLTLSLLLLTFKTFYFNTFNTYLLLIYSLLTALFCILIFLAYYDFKKMEVHNSTSMLLMLFLIIINLLLFLLLKDRESILLINNWEYNPYKNILGGIFLGSLFQLIVLITKEKGLGQGDVRIAIITGLITGLNSIIVWGYISVFSALAYGLILSRKKKRFKGLKIPFLPFMILGIIALILF